MVRLGTLLDPAKTGPEAETLDENLRKRVIGQDEAVRQVVNMYQAFVAGMASPGRPIGNLLLLGPTGSGKTRTVEALAESLAGDARAVVKIDCAEFQHSHEVAKLIGSPPGYIGHRETRAMLSQETLDQYHTVKLKLSLVLFDEIEKASDTLWNLLLGILDKATLTLGDNRRVDFSRAMIFMTSNLGATEMSSILRPGVGFAAREAGLRRADGSLDGALAERISRAGIEAARRKFTPEFINRIDRIVTFQPLGEPELRRILDLELRSVEERMCRALGAGLVALSLTDKAKEFTLRRGADARYGARHLKRAIEQLLVHPVSNLIASGQLLSGDALLVDVDAEPGRLVFVKESKGATGEVAVPAASAAGLTAAA